MRDKTGEVSRTRHSSEGTADGAGYRRVPVVFLLAEVRGRGAGEAEATESDGYPDRVSRRQLKSIDRSPGVSSSRRDRLASLLTGKPNQVARPGKDSHHADVLAGEGIHRGRQEKAAPAADEAALDALLYRIGLVEGLRLDRWGRHLLSCGGGLEGILRTDKGKRRDGESLQLGKIGLDGDLIAAAWPVRRCLLLGHMMQHVTLATSWSFGSGFFLVPTLRKEPRTLHRTDNTQSLDERRLRGHPRGYVSINPFRPATSAIPGRHRPLASRAVMGVLA